MKPIKNKMVVCVFFIFFFILASEYLFVELENKWREFQILSYVPILEVVVGAVVN